MRERWDLSKESVRGNVSRGWSRSEIDNFGWDSGVCLFLKRIVNAEILHVTIFSELVSLFWMPTASSSSQ
jgi:hypothetical protein